MLKVGTLNQTRATIEMISPKITFSNSRWRTDGILEESIIFGHRLEADFAIIVKFSTKTQKWGNDNVNNFL